VAELRDPSFDGAAFLAKIRGQLERGR
jgi:hypothetical protein